MVGLKRCPNSAVRAAGIVCRHDRSPFLRRESTAGQDFARSARRVNDFGYLRVCGAVPLEIDPLLLTVAFPVGAITGETFDPFWTMAGILEHDTAEWSPRDLSELEPRLARAVASITSV